MNDRAVSDVIGFILVFSLVASTVAIVSIAGVDTLEDVRYDEQINNAERAFDVFADNLNDIHREGAPSRATEINLQDAQLNTVGVANINVSARSGSGRNFSINVTSRVVRWRSVRDEGTTIDYTFGGVLRSQRNGGLFIEHPPMDFDPNQTYIPIVRTIARPPEAFGGNTARVRGVRGTPNIIHRGDASVYDSGSIWVNVTTQNNGTWERYLDRRPGVSCSTATLPGERDRVECELENRDELFVVVHPVEIDIER